MKSSWIFFQEWFCRDPEELNLREVDSEVVRPADGDAGQDGGGRGAGDDDVPVLLLRHGPAGGDTNSSVFFCTISSKKQETLCTCLFTVSI